MQSISRLQIRSVENGPRRLHRENRDSQHELARRMRGSREHRTVAALVISAISYAESGPLFQSSSMSADPLYPYSEAPLL